MPARRALATIAAVTLGATAIGAAVGATTQVFNVAEASPGVGRVSPVSTPTLPPIVEHHVIDVEDPPVAATPPASAPTASGPSRPGRDPSDAGPVAAPAGTPATGATGIATTTPTVAHHEAETRGEDD